MACFEPEPCDSDLCIGHFVPFAQHSIRASGVGCHPAHTARFPTQSVRTAAIAARRLTKVTTYLRCGTFAAVSNATVRVRERILGPVSTFRAIPAESVLHPLFRASHPDSRSSALHSGRGN